MQPKQMGAAAGGEDIPLFVHSAVDDYTFKINPAAQYIGGNDELFELFGILMAKALIDRNQVTTAPRSPRTCFVDTFASIFGAFSRRFRGQVCRVAVC